MWQQYAIIPIICHRCNWHWWQFATGDNFLPVSTTPAVLAEKFAAGVVDTLGKFSTGEVDTGSKFVTGVLDTGGAPSLANIFPQMFGKFCNDFNVIFEGLGEDEKKTWSIKSRDNSNTLRHVRNCTTVPDVCVSVKNMGTAKGYMFRVFAHSATSFTSSDEYKYPMPEDIKNRAITAGLVGRCSHTWSISRSGSGSYRCTGHSEIRIPYI